MIPLVLLILFKGINRLERVLRELVLKRINKIKRIIVFFMVPFSTLGLTQLPSPLFVWCLHCHPEQHFINAVWSCLDRMGSYSGLHCD